MKRLGLGMTPENRQEEGLVLQLSVRENACLACMDRLAWHKIIWNGRKTPVVDANIRDLQIAVSAIGSQVNTLSGGNQQKVVVAKWLNTKPRVLLFDEPTRGIDTHAKQQIFQLIWRLSRQGISSVFVSSELEELIYVCHRILVMREGCFVGEVTPDAVTPQSLFGMCLAL
jgi:ABC-type sugar transport system ATPase subunit